MGISVRHPQFWHCNMVPFFYTWKDIRLSSDISVGEYGDQISLWIAVRKPHLWHCIDRVFVRMTNSVSLKSRSDYFFSEKNSDFYPRFRKFNYSMGILVRHPQLWHCVGKMFKSNILPLFYTWEDIRLSFGISVGEYGDKISFRIVVRNPRVWYCIDRIFGWKTSSLSLKSKSDYFL